MQLNIWFFAILIGLVVLWKVDLFATLLNLKALGEPMPSVFEGFVDSEEFENSKEYTRARAVFGLVRASVSLIVLILFWWVGGFGWLDGWVRSWGLPSMLTGVAFVGILLIAQQLIDLPFSYYSTFVIEQEFGFNRSTVGLWLSDLVKGAALAAILGIPILLGLIWIFENVSLAWLWGWVLVTVISLILAYVAPAWIMPLFNKFEPIEEGELKQAIHEMAKKCEFPLKEVSVMDGSRRSAKSNAFFTGFGENKRIALFDTLIENHTTDELVGVLAHEIGHFKKRHIIKSMILGSLITLALFFLLGLMLQSRSLFDAFGIEQMSVYAGFVLFGIVMTPVNELLSVAGNFLSRKHEYEADAYAAEVTGNPEAMSDALRKLSADNSSHLTPHPFHVFWNYTHPPVASRVETLLPSPQP